MYNAWTNCFISYIVQLKLGILIHKLIEQFVESEKVQGILFIFSTHEAQHVDINLALVKPFEHVLHAPMSKAR